jgi:predicted phosphoadenosine phosphosulfate sulfurtransferase
MYVNEKIAEKCRVKKYPYTNHNEVCKIIAKESDTIMLSFSGGKDSLVAWLIAKEHFKTIIPVFFYRIPGLSFIDEKIHYYEDFFKTKIIQLPHPSTIKQLNNGLFQTTETIKVIEKMNLPNMTYDMFFDSLREKHGNLWVAIGNRACDNVQRYTAFITNGVINYNRKVFWPSFDFTDTDVLNIIKENKIQLPDDYRMFGKTFDSLQDRFIKVIKKEYPADYEKIKTLFPLIELEILRYEKYI